MPDKQRDEMRKSRRKRLEKIQKRQMNEKNNRVGYQRKSQIKEYKKEKHEEI